MPCSKKQSEFDRTANAVTLEATLSTAATFDHHLSLPALSHANLHRVYYSTESEYTTLSARGLKSLRAIWADALKRTIAPDGSARLLTQARDGVSSPIVSEAIMSEFARRQTITRLSKQILYPILHPRFLRSLPCIVAVFLDQEDACTVARWVTSVFSPSLDASALKRTYVTFAHKNAETEVMAGTMHSPSPVMPWIMRMHRKIQLTAQRPPANSSPAFRSSNVLSPYLQHGSSGVVPNVYHSKENTRTAAPPPPPTLPLSFDAICQRAIESGKEVAFFEVKDHDAFYVRGVDARGQYYFRCCSGTPPAVDHERGIYQQIPRRQNADPPRLTTNSNGKRVASHRLPLSPVLGSHH